jgi:hypothetical protein
MTGPEHYTEGEKWSARAEEHHAGIGTRGPGHDAKATSAALIAAAHFAAAQAAATAQQLADRYVGDGDHITEWSRATRGHDFR